MIKGLMTQKTSKMNLVEEAKKRGYKKGTPIRYVPHALDYVIGSHFEEKNGKVLAYAVPKHKRKCFDDNRHDTLFDGKEWTEIVDPSKRSKEQVRLDNLHHIDHNKF
jgi:hypothetical protein